VPLSPLARGLAWVRQRVAVQEALHERRALVDRPWEEDFLHWHRDGESWQLHGEHAPPSDGRRRSTTADGWCPGSVRPSRRSPDTPTGLD
jgi:hypothetical protein